jgi:hypothetical protein
MSKNTVAAITQELELAQSIDDTAFNYNDVLYERKT